MVRTVGDQALVLGGGMAGLLAARVLADAYRRVTIVDRDDLTENEAARRGVPQGRHAHALLARGRELLEQLFPGLTEELVAHGAPYGDALAGTRLCFSGHRFARTDAGLPMLSLSRPFLEAHVRTRVRALPNVDIAPPCDIVGLTTTPDAGRVTGATVWRRADGSPAEVVGADLVVDTTGRGTRTPRWLHELGYERPAEERVQVDVGYATCLYELPADALDGDWASLVGATPARPRGGALSRLEDGHWMLTLYGLCGDHPPTDVAGFTEFARSLPYQDIHDAIRGAAPEHGPVAHKFPADIRYHYERMARFPEGLLVLGDSVCSFNPVYGQGMTVAALQAHALATHLRRERGVRSRRLLREIARVVDIPWQMAVGADLAFPGTEGRRTRGLRIMSAYIGRLHRAAAEDASLAASFVRVSGLVDPPQTLLRPRVALRVLAGRSADRSVVSAGAS